MFFAFILVPCWLFGTLTILYKLVKNVRKPLRYLVQTWVVVFAGEMLVIPFLPREQLNFLGLQGEAGGFWYWICFTKELGKLIPTLITGIFRGYGKDFFSLLLLPVLPAIAAYWVGYREERMNKIESQKQGSSIP